MGRRYDEDETPRGEWRGLRFLGGLLLGLIVSGGVIAALSMNAPNPLHGEIAGIGQQEDAIPEPTPETPEEEPAGRDAATETRTDQSSGTSSPQPQVEPAPAPDVTAPSQPDRQDGVTLAPEPAPVDSNNVAGDFQVNDGEIAARDAGAAPEPPAPSPAETPPESPGLQLDGPALTINAVPYDAADTTPIIAIVLTGAGDSGLTEEALLSLSMPLTLAIAPAGRAAADVATAARTAGYEIVAELPVGNAGADDSLSPDLPELDIADRVDALLSRLWMSVGAMPRFTDGSSADERFSRAFIAVLERNGFAYVSPAEPSESARTVAGAFGVPLVTGDVAIDAVSTPEATYAALDRAAAQAGQAGSAVVVAPASLPMLEVLARWGLEKGGRVARVAPLSAVVARADTARSAGGTAN